MDDRPTLAAMSPVRVALGALAAAAVLSGAATTTVAASPGATVTRPCPLTATLRTTITELTVAETGCRTARRVAAAWPLRARLREIGWHCAPRGTHPVRVACARGEQRVRFHETVFVLEL